MNIEILSFIHSFIHDKPSQVLQEDPWKGVSCPSKGFVICVRELNINTQKLIFFKSQGIFYLSLDSLSMVLPPGRLTLQVTFLDVLALGLPIGFIQ